MVGRAKLSETHPNLHRAFTMYACLSIALALNFIFLNPTFDPLSIPKEVAGAVFLTLGVSKLVLLNVYRNLKLLRLAMAIAIGTMCFWGGAQVVDFFRLGQTSLQLPLTFFGLAAIGRPLLVEPSMNPVTGKNGNGQ
jgi:hypothetical protein